jgi:flavin-binding protein dodecin
VADEAEREIAEQAVRLEVRLEQANAQLVQDRERLRSAQERLRSVRKANDTAHAEQRRQLEDELRTRSRERVTRAQKSADTRVASERQSIEGKRSTAVQALQDQLSEIMHAINRAENELHDVRAMAVAKVGADIQNGASESWQDALDTQQIALDEAAMAAAAKSEAEVEVARRVEELESVRRQLGATSVTSQHDHAHMNQLSDELRSYKHSQMENANEVDRQRQLLDGIKARLRDLQAERASVESSVESDSHSEHSGHVLASANGLAHLTTHGCAWPKVNGQVLVPQQIQAAAEQLARLQQQLQQQNELRARASHEAETLQRSLRHIRREIIQIEKIDGDKMKAQLAELREATALLRFDATEVRRMRVNVEAETAKVQARLHHK